MSNAAHDEANGASADSANDAEEISKLADEHGFTVAVAESLTGGKIAQKFSAATDSGDWFAGAIVCYRPEVKYRVLGVPRGPVVTEATVRTMATGITDLMEADAVVTASGVGGPGPNEGKPAGTTWLAVLVRGDMRTQLHRFSGDPLEVIGKAEATAVRMLLDAMRASVEQ